MHVTVIGTGYVGTVTGACLAYLGHHVTCVDTDAGKIARLRRGESPIYEPHLETMLSLGAERGGLEFTTELKDAVRASDVIFIARKALAAYLIISALVSEVVSRGTEINDDGRGTPGGGVNTCATSGS